MDTVILINGLGLDGTSYKNIAKIIPKRFDARCIAMNLTGFKLSSPDCPGLSFETHAQDLLMQIKKIESQSKQSRIVLWGFSYGADLLAYTIDKYAALFPVSRTSVIFNDPNINNDTCTISRHLSTPTPQSHLGISSYVKVLAEGIERRQISIDHAGQIFEYLSTIIKKKMGNIVRIATEMASGPQKVPKWITNIRSRGFNVRAFLSGENMLIDFCGITALKPFQTNGWIEHIDQGHFYLNSLEHQLYSLSLELRVNVPT